MDRQSGRLKERQRDFTERVTGNRKACMYRKIEKSKRREREKNKE